MFKVDMALEGIARIASLHFDVHFFFLSRCYEHCKGVVEAVEDIVGVVDFEAEAEADFAATRRPRGQSMNSSFMWAACPGIPIYPAVQPDSH